MARPFYLPQNNYQTFLDGILCALYLVRYEREISESYLYCIMALRGTSFTGFAFRPARLFFFGKNTEIC